jgi:hypothetical protein
MQGISRPTIHPSDADIQEGEEYDGGHPHQPVANSISTGTSFSRHMTAPCHGVTIYRYHDQQATYCTNQSQHHQPLDRSTRRQHQPHISIFHCTYYHHHCSHNQYDLPCPKTKYGHVCPVLGSWPKRVWRRTMDDARTSSIERSDAPCEQDDAVCGPICCSASVAGDEYDSSTKR